MSSPDHQAASTSTGLRGQPPPPYFPEEGLDTSGSGTDDEEHGGGDRGGLDASAESEQLDPAMKAVHEADTLPMGGIAPPPATASSSAAIVLDAGVTDADQKSSSSQRTHCLEKLESALSPVLAEKNPLPEEPSRTQIILQSLRCPPHGRVGLIAGLVLLPVIVWLTCLAVFGPAAAAPPKGPMFLLIVLVVLALVAGKCVSFVRLPPLLGMLLVGIVLRNLPGVTLPDDWKTAWSPTLRGLALVIILMRAGLGLDPDALRRLSGMVFRLAFSPCLAETLTVAVASHFILNFPWLWGLILGFLMSAVSPAVVVPCLLQLQEKGYGVSKGIPTLVIAAASVDDVLAISGFTILLGITFKPGEDLVASIFQGPLEALIGIVFGVFYGILAIYLPTREDSNFWPLRCVYLLGGGMMALFGSQRLNYLGSGALAVLVMAFVAGVGWRRQAGDEGESAVAKFYAKLWILFQPILFGLIGMEIELSNLDTSTIGLGICVLLVGLSVRIAVSYVVVYGGNLSARERLFVALAWLPKATVQAAFGSLALDTANSMDEPNPDFQELGQKVLTIAVLVILITAPLGAAAIILTAPKLLSQDEDEAASAPAAEKSQ